jgi:hypothetical protein
VEYSYSGKMTLLGLSIPRWFSGNDKFTKWNPDVFGCDAPCIADGQSWWTRLVKTRIFGRSPLSVYLRFNQRLWNRAPASILSLSPIRSYGRLLLWRCLRSSLREQSEDIPKPAWIPVDNLPYRSPFVPAHFLASQQTTAAKKSGLSDGRGDRPGAVA